MNLRTSLAFQRLRLQASTAEGMQVRELKSHMYTAWPDKKKWTLDMVSVAITLLRK